MPPLQILFAIKPHYADAIVGAKVGSWCRYDNKDTELRRALPSRLSIVGGGESDGLLNDGCIQTWQSRHDSERDIMLIYATAPVSAVIGAARITGTLSGAPSAMWERCKRSAGISEAEFMRYFAGCTVAHAIQLGRTVRYRSPRGLLTYGIRHAPQSFCYVPQENAPHHGLLECAPSATAERADSDRAGCCDH